jgi:hypothetical protein
MIEPSDRTYQDADGNWVFIGPSGVHRIICPRCCDGGGGVLRRIQIGGEDDLFYLCDECDALWLVSDFRWAGYPGDHAWHDVTSFLEERLLTRGDIAELDAP